MADLDKLNQSIEAAVQSLLELKRTINTELQTVEAQSVPAATETEEAPLLDTFETLKKAVHTDKWPAAVNPSLICDPNSPSDQTERARGVIELMIEEDLDGKKFLDYGCGKGYIVTVANGYNPKFSLGYDIENQWGDSPQLTTDWNVVEQNGPYDVILLFDVLDHLKAEPPVKVLKRLHGLLADGGKIYMRCHPFTSRHATHLYNTLNKAFLHLVFTEDELKQLVPEPKNPEESIGVLYPIKTYNEFIEQAGLKVVNRRDLTEKVENFFRIPKIAERITQNTKFGTFPEFQMSLQFIDYVLEK